MMATRCLAASVFLFILLFLPVQPTEGAPLHAAFPASFNPEPFRFEASRLDNGASSTPQHLEFCPSTVSKIACAAEFLALESSGELLPPPQLYEQIFNDLTAIRAAYPDMSLINHLPRWLAGQLTVTLTEAAWVDYTNDSTAPFAALETAYQPTTVTQTGLDRILFLEFEQRYNPEPLAMMYMALDGISEAFPEGFVGDASTIRAAPPTYSFDLKWGSCAAGCINKYTWEYVVSDGVVKPLNSESGAILQPDTAAELTMQDAITLTFASGSVTHTTIVTATSDFTPTQAMNNFIFIGRSVRTGALDASDSVLSGVDMLQGADAGLVEDRPRFFMQPYTVTMTYDDADWQAFDISNESALNVYAMADGHWQALLPCNGCTMNTAANTITLQTDQTTDFALMQRVNWSLHLPTISQAATDP